MNEETARYLASYLLDNKDAFFFIDMDGEQDWNYDGLKEVIVQFFEELP